MVYRNRESLIIYTMAFYFVVTRRDAHGYPDIVIIRGYPGLSLSVEGKTKWRFLLHFILVSKYIMIDH